MLRDFVLSLDFVRFYLHIHADSSNLDLLFLNVFKKSRRKLPEFGCHRCIVSQNNKGPRLQVRDPAGSREFRGSCFEQQLLQVDQAARVPGKRREIA